MALLSTVHTPSVSPDALGVTQALLREKASIAPKYFYDDTGSALFGRITQLPEYYPTRTEQNIM
jgi:uncharacterized SAM-dependent methyltransferase